MKGEVERDGEVGGGAGSRSEGGAERHGEVRGGGA
jgi:hypothetical protein